MRPSDRRLAEEVWVEEVARYVIDALAGVSTPISSQWRLYGEGFDDLASVRAALISLARREADRLSELLGEPSGARSVVSFCTGYDAAVEILALTRYLGGLERYLSVDLDEGSVLFNRGLMALCPPPGVDRCRFMHGDIRRAQLLQELFDEDGEPDLCVLFRPPLGPTAYGDEEGKWLSDRVDASVFLELLAHRKSGLLSMPVCGVFFSPEEGRRLSALCSALGETEARRSVQEMGFYLPSRR